MNPSVSELLVQGVVISVIGMGLVFAALALLWGLIRLLGAIFDRGEERPTEPRVVPIQAVAATAARETEGTDNLEEQLTAERARVAAVAAAALLSNALPMLFEVPSGPAFEHGRTAPSWVTSNRARNLRSWQPPRSSDAESG